MTIQQLKKAQLVFAISKELFFIIIQRTSLPILQYLIVWIVGEDCLKNNTNNIKDQTLKSRKVSNRAAYWIYFIFIFTLFCIYFTYLTIYKLDGLWTKDHVLLNFYILQFAYIKKIKLYFLISAAAIIPILTYAYFKLLLKKSFLRKKYLVCLLATIVVGFFGFNFSFIGSYIFSVSELMLIEYKISSNPQPNNLIWDNELISQKLNDTVIIPKIIIAEDNLNSQIASYIITSKNNRSEFFKKNVLMPSLDIFSINFLIPNKSSIVMFRDNLYIRNFDGDSFQNISPSLGKLLVRNEFGSISGKDAPFIKTLAKDEYKSFRIHQINSRIRDMETLIDKLNYAIGLINKEMLSAKSNINYYKSLANSSYSQGESAFLRCSIAETCSSTYVPGYCGYFYCTSGYFIRNCTPMFSYSYCSSLRDSYYATGDQYIDTSNYWVGQYNDLVALFNEANEYKDKAVASKAIAEASKENISFELGMFMPDNNIKIAISSTESRMASEYISTLIHEYLHYDSYVSKDKSLPLFFEEGLTEYFSRKTQKNELGSDTNLGYPLITKIIERIAEKIPEQDLKEIYFSKDVDLLKASLEKNLGKDFFKKNEYYFAIISYIPSKIALSMANDMLEKIDLRKIEEDEIYKISSLEKLN